MCFLFARTVSCVTRCGEVASSDSGARPHDDLEPRRVVGLPAGFGGSGRSPLACRPRNSLLGSWSSSLGCGTGARAPHGPRTVDRIGSASASAGRGLKRDRFPGWNPLRVWSTSLRRPVSSPRSLCVIASSVEGCHQYGSETLGSEKVGGRIGP